MNNSLTVGLFLSPDKRADIEIEDALNRLTAKTKWKFKQKKEIDVSFFSNTERLRLRKDGAIFYFKKFGEGYVEPRELKRMWNELIGALNILDLNINYENEINFLLHSKDINVIFNKNRKSIIEFGKNVLNKYSISVTKINEVSKAITIYPIPEVVSLRPIKK